MRIYLAGPMTGLPDFNYPAFNSAAKELRARGHEVINPAENFQGRQDLPREFYMIKALQTLSSVAFIIETVVLLPRWETSAGAQLEVHAAEEMGIKVLRLEEVLK